MSARNWSTSASCRRCRVSPASCKNRGLAVPANILFQGLSGYLLPTCLLKTVFCCVRVSNHVPCRRVALLASRAAGRGAGADVRWVCRLQRRHADALFAIDSFSNPFASQPEATGSVRAARRSSAASCRNMPGRRARRNISPSRCRRRSPHRSPIRSPAAACPEEGAGFLPMRRRRIRRSKPPATVPPRSVAADRARPAPAGGTTIIVGTSDTLEILARRYNVSTAAILQANGYKGPRALSPGQQLIIPRRTAAAARRRHRHVAPPASKPVAAARRRRASTSSIAATRCISIARRNQCAGGRARQGQQSRSIGQAQPRHEAHGARREDPRRRAGAAAVVAAPAQPAALARAGHQAGRAGGPPQSRAAGVGDHQVVEEEPAVESARSSPAKPPARCRPSAGRCAAR